MSEDKTDYSQPIRMLSRIEFLLDGAMIVRYFNVIIAIIDANGSLLWRDVRFPLYLIEYLIMQPDHSKDQWN